MRQQRLMDWAALIRRTIKTARARGSRWVKVLDVVRFLPSADGRARLWTQFAHSGGVHQTSSDTWEERYPELFDLSARLLPKPNRILSFGCSTGEELLSLRRHFPDAEIVGAEINPRSRRIAAERVADDGCIQVVRPDQIAGPFDLVFALAVFQREPHKIAETGVQTLTRYYPFSRFNSGVSELVGRLRPGGYLCVTNAHYRVEDSTAAESLIPITDSPTMDGTLFDADGQRLPHPLARTIFRKR